MSIIYQAAVPDPNALIIRDPNPEICHWHGRKALRLSGQGACLLVVPEVSLSQGWVEVDLGSGGAAYPGIAFRGLDSLNYELAYIQPHTSGQWDAIQYDPVFHGSNTWQLYHGAGAQKSADVPADTWLHFRVAFQGRSALIQVGEQPPLLVHPLAHKHLSGLLGLWTYLPAYFSNLCIGDDRIELGNDIDQELREAIKPGTITEWFMEGFGLVDTEINGILNLNRYLPVMVDEVTLVRDIDVQEAGTFTFKAGFSDQLSLQMDDEVIFTGEHLYHNAPEWESRGYVRPEKPITCHLNQGKHRLTAKLTAKESFGFGITIEIEGSAYRLLPAQLHQ